MSDLKCQQSFYIYCKKKDKHFFNEIVARKNAETRD